MNLVIYGLLPAALVLFLKQERTGLWMTLWPCLAGFGLGCCIAIAIASYSAGTLAIDLGGVATSAVAMIIAGFVVNRDLLKRRPPDDLRG